MSTPCRRNPQLFIQRHLQPKVKSQSALALDCRLALPSRGSRHKRMSMTTGFMREAHLLAVLALAGDRRR